MLLVRCACGHEGAWYIVELTEDYVTLRCPHCEHEFGVAAAQDQER